METMLAKEESTGQIHRLEIFIKLEPPLDEATAQWQATLILHRIH